MIDIAVAQVLVHVPMCPESLVELYLKKALDDVLDKVDGLSDWLVPLRTQKGLRKYPIDICGAGLSLKAVRSVLLDGQPILGFKVSNGVLILPDESADDQTLKIKVAFKSDGSDGLPDEVAMFENGLVAWALWHLLKIPKQPWYNRTLSDEFRREYVREKNVLETELEAQAMASDASLGRMSNPVGFV